MRHCIAFQRRRKKRGQIHSTTCDLARPVGSERTDTVENVDEGASDNTLSLLARVELVEPEESIWVVGADTVCAIDAAVVDVTSGVVWSSAIEVAAWVVVNVGEEAVHVHDGKVGAWEAVHNLDHVWGAVLVDGVDGDYLLEHAVGDGGKVLLRLGWPVLVVADTTLAWKTVERSKLERSYVLENEEAGAEVVKRLNLVEDTVHVGDEVSAWDLAVGEDSINSEVIGADPDAVDGALCWSVDKFGSVSGGICAVGNVSRNLVLLNGWKVGINGGEDTRGNVVGADCARDGVVVEVGTSVLLDVLGPCTTTIGSVVVLKVNVSDNSIGVNGDMTYHWVRISDWRSRAVV